MTNDSPPPVPRPEPTDNHPATPTRATATTRTGYLWTAVTFALLLLVLLVVFILQNAGNVRVRYFGYAGSLPLGVALLIAAVGGGLVVAMVGVGRISQLRLRMRQTKRHAAAGSTDNS